MLLSREGLCEAIGDHMFRCNPIDSYVPCLYFLAKPVVVDIYVFKRRIVTNLNAASIPRAERNGTPFSQYLTERTGEQGTITKGQRPSKAGHDNEDQWDATTQVTSIMRDHVEHAPGAPSWQTRAERARSQCSLLARESRTKLYDGKKGIRSRRVS
jgi:hypothetical protein